MSYNPGVSVFVSFLDLDSLGGSQCIYFTQKGLRCRHNCSKSDNTLAIRLRNSIGASPSETADLELLCDYISLKCCKSGRHRNRIEDAGLLVPLALRWQDEIYGQNRRTIPIRAFDPAAHRAPLTPDRGFMTDLDTSSYQLGYILRTEATAKSPCPMSARSSVTNASGYERIDLQPRYNLRSREVDVQVPFKSSLTELDPIVKPLSEFRPHKPNSRPADSVSSKVRTHLRKRDFEIGSLYIFDRASSPGHVKIGWTAVSVGDRLNDWAKCEYTPNLIFHSDNVPHAQRVETLVHHELINEWRRERQCKGCRKSHREWFEVSKERAMQVLKSWTDFMKEVQPYDFSGRLKSRQREIVERMDRHGELVTGQRMLECYRESVPVIRTSLTDKPAQQSYQLESEKVPRRRSQFLIENSSVTPREVNTFVEPDPHKEAVEKAILKLVDRLCSEVATRRVISGVPGVGETLRSETPLPVALVA